MKGRIDLTQGKITEKLVKLSLPIMATSFIQMAYNMIDMIWVGKAGSSSVAAVGTAGFFTWLAMAFITISKVGAEVKVAQSMGQHDVDETKLYIKSAIEINIILSILYTIFLIMFKDQLIGFFRLGDENVISMSKEYLVIVAFGMIFYFNIAVFTAIFNGMGNSKTPFLINTIGLLTNIVLDPILILGLGKIPSMGVAGAAIATVVAQIVVTSCFMLKILKSKEIYFKIIPFKDIKLNYYKILYNLGIPVALQSGLFTLFSMTLGVVVASFGPVAVAVQKVGSQIESISWMSAEGIAAALSSFVGQNYGSKDYDRIQRGCKITLLIAIIMGTINTILLVFLGKYIFSIFINESEAILKGADYLKILGYSQLFMCIEIVIAGAFRGLGKTLIPSLVSIILTGSRIPLAYLISNPSILGLNGVWWSISISSILKGILLLSIFIILIRTQKLYGFPKLKPNFVEDENNI